MAAPLPAGTLYVIALPIGNRDDLSPRAAARLAAVGHVASEDTRSALRLLRLLGFAPPRMWSLFEHNEEGRVPQLLALLSRGEDVALISEAGTPTVSDPGYRLVKACAEAGVKVVPVPGPCAAVAALCASGLPTARFLFLGFPPRKGAKLDAFLADALCPGRTAVVYLPARRVAEFLGEVERRVPATQVVIARELTKTFEEFVRGRPAELRAQLASRELLGECTLVLYVPTEA
jgi:16S rRNA (cytidine1402-2'-O)-methyltransferase